LSVTRRLDERARARRHRCRWSSSRSCCSARREIRAPGVPRWSGAAGDDKCRRCYVWALRRAYGRMAWLKHAVKGRMPTDGDQAQPKPLALAVVRKAIEESRGRVAHVTEETCRSCGSPTVETYSSLPWGTQVRLLVCLDLNCGAVAAVPTRQLDGPPPLGPGTTSS
jgi:hypothetical protein